MPSFVRFLALVCAIATSALAVAADEQQVSGSFALGEVKVSPAHVVAIRARDGNQPRSDRTVVFLTSVPMDRTRLEGQRDAYAMAINDSANYDLDTLTFFLNENGDVSMNAKVGGVQYVDSSGTIMGQPGALKVDCPTRSTDRVDCRVWVEKPVDVQDGPAWTLDVKFATGVIPKLGGKPLPKDGGEPGKALTAFVAALQGDDLDSIFALMTEDRMGQHNASYNTPEENLASTKDIWSARLPKQIKITGGELVSDELAFLEVEGELYPGMPMLFEVEMGRREGRWAVQDGGTVGILR